MEEVYINGMMENNMMDNMKMTRNVDLEYFIGLMVNNIKDIGWMENSMERAS